MNERGDREALRELDAVLHELMRRGFHGPRPGSNAWPLLQLECRSGTLDGEIAGQMIQDGWFVGSVVPGFVLAHDEASIADFDVDVTHSYDVTEEGRRALARGAGAVGGVDADA